MKELLATPGPTPLPPAVQRALAQPMIYHRAPVFAELMAEVSKGLKTLFQTKEDVLILASSGTGAMEAAIANLTSPGETIITIEAGKFGERWGELGRAYGLKVVADTYEYGQGAELTRVKKLLETHSAVRLVCVQACETSTGVQHPIKQLAELTRQYKDTLFVVDGITAIGIVDVPMDQWGIDVLLGGSQKALMLPPGLAFIAMSQEAWKVQEKAKQPRYYFDLAKEKKSQEKNQSAYTPAVNLVQGLKESLNLILNTETREKVFARHAIMAEATRAFAKALGFELFSKGEPANGVTAIKAPEGIAGDVIVKQMRNRYGITIAGGQGTMKGKIFRLAHMGYVYPTDMLLILSTLEMALQDVGYKRFELGAGVAAAQKVFVRLNG